MSSLYCHQVGTMLLHMNPLGRYSFSDSTTHFHLVPQPLATAAAFPVCPSVHPSICLSLTLTAPTDLQSHTTLCQLSFLLTNREIPSIHHNTSTNTPRNGLFPRLKASQDNRPWLSGHNPWLPAVPLTALCTLAPALSSLSHHTLNAIHSWAISCMAPKG